MQGTSTSLLKFLTLVSSRCFLTNLNFTVVSGRQHPWKGCKTVSQQFTHKGRITELHPARENWVTAIRNGPPASVAAKPDLLAAGGVRAEDRDGPHISVFHEAFAHFLAKFDDLSTPIPSDVYANAARLFDASQQLYHEKEDRVEAVRPYVEKLMNDQYLSVSVPGAQPGGVVLTAGAGRPIAYRAFLEFESKIGDPVAKGVEGYEKFWAHKEVRHIDCRQSLFRGLSKPFRPMLFVHHAVVRAL